VTPHKLPLPDDQKIRLHRSVDLLNGRLGTYNNRSSAEIRRYNQGPTTRIVLNFLQPGLGKNRSPSRRRMGHEPARASCKNWADA